MMDENNSLPFPEGEASGKHSRKRWFLPVLFLFLVVTAGGFFLFFTGTEDEKAPPVVEAPNPPIVTSEEIKSPPDEPGGLEIAHQDKLIYDRLTPADVSVSNEDALDEVMMGLIAEDPLADFSTSKSDGDPTELATSSDSTADSPEPTASPDSAENSSEPANVSIESEEGVPKESLPEETAEPASESPVTTLPESNSAGGYVVQLAAFTRSADADVALARITSKFSDVADTNTFFIQEADLGDRGIWHRLRVGYFAALGEAAEICAKFQSRGQDCLVSAR